MLIRAADDRDFPAIADITNHYIAKTAVHFGYDPVTAQSLRAAWKLRFPWLVTVDDAGTVLGYAKAGAWRERAAYDWTTEVGIYFAPAACGKGLGKPLYEALFADLVRRGYRSAIGCITLPNDASIALHRALGFVSTGTVREAGWKLGKWHDVEFWQKALRSGDGEPQRFV